MGDGDGEYGGERGRGVEGEEFHVVVVVGGGGGGVGGGEVVGRVTPVYLWCEGLVGRVQRVSCTG